MRALILILLATGAAWAQEAPPVPGRQLPPEVLAGVAVVERSFADALAADCAPERCFAKGCTYVAHSVVDRPSAASLPGLGADPGPGAAPRQVFLTTVECSFTHEKSVRARDAKTLAERLEAKLSKSWTKVKVTAEALRPVPEFLRESPDEPDDTDDEEPEPLIDPDAVDAGVAAPKSPAWDGPVAGRELWLSVLPHIPWMLGLLLLTFAGLILIWALRRLGRVSPEEQALLAQMVAEASTEKGAEVAEIEPPTSDAAAERVAARRQAWRDRLAHSDVEADQALQVLVKDLLRTGERRMLAKAVILFPEAFPRAFPQGGDFASAKFELAEYLKHAEPAGLPADEAFFDTLDRYAMSAALTAHADTELIRSLHDDFGAAALVDVVGRLPARAGALMFAVAPEARQHEAVRRLHPNRLAELVDQLMRSNRMDPAETAYLLDVLRALRAGEPLPAPPTQVVSDRGAAFNAPASLSIMLPHVDPEVRAALVDAARQRNAGSLPDWMHDTLFGEMLLRLPDEARTDLMLEVPVDQLAAWLRVQTDGARTAITQRMPSALRAAVGSMAVPSTPGALYALANDARAALAAGVRRFVARTGASFDGLLR